MYTKSRRGDALDVYLVDLPGFVDEENPLLGGFSGAKLQDDVFIFPDDFEFHFPFIDNLEDLAGLD